MNKTLCFFNSNKSWGGGEQWHYDMATRLAARNYRVIVYAYPGSELYKRVYKHKSVEAREFRVSNTSFLNPLRLHELTKAFLADNISTIILNLPSDLKLAGPAAKKAGIPKIIYRRGSALPVKDTLLNRYYFKKIITSVLVNSKATRDTLLQNNPKLIEQDKINILYNGLDLKVFDCKPEDDLPGKENTIIIGNLGRLVYQKGQEMLLELAEILAERNVPFKLVIGGEGPFRKKLQASINKKGLQSRVKLTGKVTQPASFLRDIDIFVLSSRWEGFGYVIAEAMACNKPVVAFNISSNPELIKDGETGFLVESFKVKTMAARIMELIKDEKLRKEMGLKGRKRVENYFTLERVIKKLEEII